MSHLQKLSRWALSLFFVGGLPGFSTPPGTAFPTAAAPPPSVASAHRPHPLVTTPLTTTVVEIAPIADTYLASGRPTQNFGTQKNLFLGYSLTDTFGAERMLLRFDLSSVPTGAVVQAARLRLYLSEGSPVNDAPMGTIVRRLAANWSESTATWNTEPAWGSLSGEASVGLTRGWYEWPLTALVSDWVQNPQSNQGVEVEGDENVQQRERAFYSRETTTAFYPRLTVTYTIVIDTQPPQVTVNPLPPYSNLAFLVTWSGSDVGAAGLHHFDVQYQVGGGTWLDWQLGVSVTATEFIGLNGLHYAFRARGVDNAGNSEAYGAAEAQTLVDILPPTVWINPLPSQVTATPFSLSWHGDDHGGSGLRYYDIRYRFNGGVWINWQNCTLATSAEFAALADGLYEFEARGTDNAYRVEAFIGQPEAQTLRDVEAPFIVPRLWLAGVWR